MKLQLLTMLSLAAFFAVSAQAQMFTPAKTAAAPKAAVKTEPAPAAVPETAAQPTVTADDILKQIETQQADLPPVTMTPEQKAAVKKPLVEQILQDVDKATPKERRELINVMEQLQKVQTRRKNLSLPEDKQITPEEPRVSAASKKDVQEYLQDKLVAPVDRTMNLQ